MLHQMFGEVTKFDVFPFSVYKVTVNSLGGGGGVKRPPGGTGLNDKSLRFS